MLNQTFNPQSLKRLVSSEDIKTYKLGSNNIDLMKSITSISYTVSQKDFTFSKIRKSTMKGKDIFTIDDKNEYFAIKKLNSIIKRIYTISHSNRNDILTQLIEIINDGSNYKIIRADIKDFFGNVPRKKIIDKIKSDSLLGSLMINKLNQLEDVLKHKNCQGLPRGVSISSTLSEIYLRDFDSAIQNTPFVYYYARYVDDIIIVCVDDKLEKVESILAHELNKIDLSFNDKYSTLNCLDNSASFDYLGVKFNFNDGNVKYLLSTNKIKNIKSKVIKSILDYRNNKDDNLLINRIKLLTSNYNLYTKTESNSLKAGIYYNNQNINNYEQLNELNEFLRKSFTSKNGSLAKTVKFIPRKVASNCMRQCFFKGYIEKKMVNFTGKDMANIVRCWKHG